MTRLALGPSRPAAAWRWPAGLHAAWWLAAAGAVLHLALASLVELSPDEAHYALYGVHPDWSYFDHPPLVGWLQAVAVRLGGSDLAMRIVPMACWLATVAAMLQLVRALPLGERLSPAAVARAEAWATGLLVASPLLNLLGVALVPDTLLMPLVPIALLATWRLREPGAAARPRAWATLAVALALATLAKYTGVFLVLGAGAALLRFHGRRLWRLQGLWWTGAALALAWLPIAGWNLAHHGASMLYQAVHALGHQPWNPVNLLRAASLQLVMYGPLLLAGMAAGLRRPMASAGDGPRLAQSDAQALVLGFALPVGAVALALSGRGGSLPHWTACGWTALVPLAAAGAAELHAGWRRGLAGAQLALLGALLGLVLAGGPGSESGAVAATGAGERVPGARPNPVADLYGWRAAAEEAARLASAQGVASISVVNWSLASRLAWYARPWPVHVVDDRRDQFTLWFGRLSPGESSVLVDSSQMSLALPVGPRAFAGCRLFERMPVNRLGRQVSHFDFYVCERWQGAA